METPAAIAITGGPGIGKSTLCLSAMHAPEVAEKYGANRFFVSCDGAVNADKVLVELSNILGITSGPDLKERVWAKLSEGSHLITIDNAETPMGHDREAFEAFLAQLYGMNNITLLLTIRGIGLPYGLRWEKTYKLKPLPAGDSKEVFLATAGEAFREDPHLGPVIQELDRSNIANRSGLASALRCRAASFTSMRSWRAASQSMAA